MRDELSPERSFTRLARTRVTEPALIAWALAALLLVLLTLAIGGPS